MRSGAGARTGAVQMNPGSAASAENKRSCFQSVLTRLSSLLATMDANLCSPASSDMRKTYSGAVTWFDL